MWLRSRSEESPQPAPTPLRMVFGAAAPLCRIPAEAVERSMPFAGAAVQEAELVAWDAKALLSWGIFNPYGPTFCCVGTAPTEQDGVELLWYRAVNPFRQLGLLIGSVVGADRSGERLAGALVRLLNGNAVPAASGELVKLVTCCPDWVMVHAGDPEINRFACRCFAGCAEVAEAELATRITQILRHFGEPWDRASEERAQAWEPVRHSFRTQASAQPGAPAPSRRHLLEAWWRLIGMMDHIVPELAAFPDAWDGAIGFQRESGNAGLADSAYPMSQLESFADRVGIDVFRVIRERKDVASDSEG